ncbi:peptidoglycan D,D-transpeptidase FtsI family protein [Actinomadura flavalba]|uniref:peptidoglycan D,D-transpeptidase FtsI family protein n=1 Tax=Actinomadura flavalba TaxID=1120938 RepID=UPI000364BDC0|nr:penicillin-binding protein 2 [Actinomadura flavalba]
MSRRPGGPPAGGRGRPGRSRGPAGGDGGPARVPGRGTPNRAPGGGAPRRPGRPVPQQRTGTPRPSRPAPGSAAPRGAAGRTGQGAPPRRDPARGGGPPRRPPRPPRPKVAFHRRDPLKRLNGTLLVIAFVLSLFAGRLVQLQTIESQQYTAKARDQRLQEIKLPAVRGDITDANDNPLAMTVEARAIYADPKIIKPEKRDAIVRALSPMLGLDPRFVQERISRPGSRYEVLARGVRPDQARLIMGMKLVGIGMSPEYRREYPNDSLAAGVIGFVNAEGKGAAGLESSMNGELAGRDGWQRVEISTKGQHIPMGESQRKPSVPGKGVRLTLLRDIQFKAQQAIEQQVKKSGARSGSVIVMDPRSGALLALASAPGYNPNDYGKSKSWGTPIVQEAYEPGSTGKVVTAAAVMEKGGVTPETPFLRVPDRIKRYGVTFGDSHPHEPWDLTFAGVLAKSSNVGTIRASERISSQQLYDTMRDFGFGATTGIGLPAETAGVLAPPSKWSGTDRYPISFGQTMSVNAVQMASVYATIANGGVRVAPNLVAGSVDENGAFTAAKAPAKRQVISAETARQIRDMLEGVTTKEGTAPLAQIPNYRVAGKTGTAEIVNPRTGRYKGGGFTASFAGFAPADDPQLVVQVVLQKPSRGSHLGGDVAAPVFRDVMSAALATRKIPPTGSRPPSVKIFARD